MSNTKAAMVKKTPKKKKAASKKAKTVNRPSMGGDASNSKEECALKGASANLAVTGDPIIHQDGTRLLPIGKAENGDELFLAEDPITWRQYLAFCAASGYPKPDLPTFFGELEILAGTYLDHPVVNVSFIDAMNYCAFYGLDLPTEDEWLQAAKHPEGAYPWGKDEPSKEHLNCAEFGPGKTTPVGNYPKGNGKYGHHDLAGNVWEWCRNKEDKPADFVDPAGPLAALKSATAGAAGASDSAPTP